MNIWLILGIIALAFAIGLLFGRLYNARTIKKQSQGRLADVSEPVAYSDDVRGLVRAGRKIEAIKRYREETGVGLKEAKNAVDRLYAEISPPGRFTAMNESQEYSDEGLGSGSLRRERMDDSVAYSDEVRSLVRAGRKIEAIKRYREEMGVGLKEAKDAVDRLEAKLRMGNGRY